MHMAPKCQVKYHFPLFIAVAVYFALFSGARFLRGQDLTWLPKSGVTDPNNWFDANNWEPLNSTPPHIPTPADVASVNTTTDPLGAPAVATVAMPGAVANELLIGAIQPSTPGEVIVTGTSSSLGLSSGKLSLEVINGSLLVENGGTLTATGVVTVEPAGQINIGDGALSGTLNAAAITNNGVISADFTDTATLSAQISGRGSIEQNGSGTLTLTGNNFYTGPTMINAGVLSISQDSNLGISPTSPGVPVANQLTFNGGMLQATATFALAAFRGITLDAGGGTFDVTAANVLTYGGVIAGAGGLTKIDAGTLTLAGVNTYTGITTINAGVLSISQDANLGTVPGAPVADQLSLNGGTLQATASFTLSANRGVTLDLGGGTIDVTGANVLTYDGVIAGTGNLAKIGTGALTLGGVNAYSGSTTLIAGILMADSAGAFSGNSSFIVNAGAELDLHGFSNTVGSLSGSGLVTDSVLLPATLTVGGDNTSTTFSGILGGPGILSLTKVGTGTLTLTGTNTYTGVTTIDAGVLSISQDANLGTAPGALVDDQLTLNGGTLQVTASFTLNANRGVTLDTGGGTFDVIGGNVLTYGGVITGTGTLTKIGTGTTVLVGDSNYAGGTTINAGTLQLGNGGTTGSITGNVTDNGILAFDRSNALTFFAGVISGTGSVQQIGTGTTVLVGDSNYAGGTTINAGTLQLGNGGTTGSITGNITDNGNLAFNRSNALSFGGVISGTGAVQQIGTGTTVLLGDNTYAGGTTINAGTLQLGNGGTTGSITGNVTDNGILAFNRSNVLTFGGIISGTGSVQQNGPGTTVLDGKNTYTGATTVNAGSLIVDGSIASVQTLVNPGGLLGGQGFIGSLGSLNGNLVNSGIVRPGDSPGTLTVNGNYAQTAAGTLRIEVASVTEHGLLAVGGHASLAGTLQLIGLSGFTLHVGDQFTFLTANGGVSGTFGTVQNEISTGTVVQAQVVTLPNAVLLEGAQGSFVPAACNPNSAAVARALDSAVGNLRASALIAFLNDQAFNNLCGDFTLIAPEALASIFDAGVSFANVQTANLKRRLEDVRAGDNGFNSSGFSLNGGTSNFSTGLAGVTGPEGKSGPSVMAPTPENRWGIWVTGLGEFANVSSTNEAAGFDIQTGGVTFGVDYRVCSIFAVGLTAGYANMNADLPNGGSLDVNSGQFGLYATLFGKGFYADAAITGGPSGYDSRRTALLGSANGNTGGGNFNVLAAVGYDWTKGGLSVGPTANFQYTYVGISGFTESGSIAPLNIDSQNVESERTAIGMKASYEWKVGHVIIKPEISAAWQHEFGDQSYSIVSSFANGAGNSFTVSSPPIGRDSLLIGAGTAVLLNDRLSIYAYYDGELLRTNYQSNDVSAGVRLTF
jgi:fibronectin-binding autotransporter adhesin